MFLFKPKPSAVSSHSEQTIFYPGDQDIAKLNVATAKQQYEELCGSLVKTVISKLREPCVDHKALIHTVLKLIEQESKKIATLLDFQDKFCQLRNTVSFAAYLESVKASDVLDDTKVKITSLRKYDKQQFKEYIGHGYDQIALALHGKEYNRFTDNKGLIQGILPAKDGKSRYIFKIYKQTSCKVKYLPTGREEVLSLNNTKKKLNNVDQSLYQITPRFDAGDEIINDAIERGLLAAEAGIYKDYQPKDVVVGEIEILYKNTWLVASRHLTGRFADTKASLIDEDIPCNVIRSEVDVIEPFLNIIASHLKIVLDKNSNLSDIHSNIASIIHLFELSCPYLSANTHATRIITVACYCYHDLYLQYNDELDHLFNHAIYAPWLDRFAKKAAAVLKRSCITRSESEKLFAKNVEEATPSVTPQPVKP